MTWVLLVHGKFKIVLVDSERTAEVVRQQFELEIIIRWPKLSKRGRIGKVIFPSYDKLPLPVTKTAAIMTL
jgi:hypothetical protein